MRQALSGAGAGGGQLLEVALVPGAYNATWRAWCGKRGGACDSRRIACLLRLNIALVRIAAGTAACLLAQIA